MDQKDIVAKSLLALACVEELTYKKKSTLLEAIGDPGRLRSEKALVSKCLGDEHAAGFFSALERADDIINELTSREIHWLHYLEDGYPDRLREIDDPPITLFVKGNVAALNSDCISVVGTRTPTRYGSKVAEEFSREFARAGLTVVSGFARGVDGIAHKACVADQCPTIAVFACGLDVCYPAEHRGLMDSIILNEGALVSEYPLGTKPLQYHFPERNRIISGLSRAVFLTEAAKKSGSLITARLAIEQGRDVFAVPGNIYAAESEGTNALLMEIPHAMVLSPADVLDAMHVARTETTSETVELSLAESQVVEALHNGELHFEELLDKTGLSVSDLTNALLNLDVDGIVQNTGGNYYALA